MPDDNNVVNQNNSTPPAAPVSATPAADSPWNEPLPEETSKQQVMGTLAGNNQPTVSPTVAPSQPFALPANIEKTMPPQLSVANGTLAPATPSVANGTLSVPPVVKAVNSTPTAPDPAFDFNFDQTKPSSAKAPDGTPATSSPNIQTPPVAPQIPNNPPVPVNPPVLNALPTSTVPIDSISKTPPSTLNPVPQSISPSVPQSQPINADIMPAAMPVPPVVPVAIPQPPVQPVAPVMAAPMPPVQPEPILAVPTPLSTAPEVPPAAPPTGLVQKIKLSKLFAGLKRKPKEVIPSTQALVPPETAASSRFKSKTAIIVYIVLAVIFLLGFLIYLTEAGILSIGLEKTYDAIGLEKLWGGLPADSQTALAKSFVVMRDHQQFKVSGTITLNVDKTIKNTVTTPLVSQNDAVLRLAVLPIKAILADVTTTDPSTTSTTDPSTVSTDSTVNSSSASTGDASSTGSSSTSTTTTTPTDQSAETTYTDTTTTKTINSVITGSFGNAGSDIEINIIKPIGSQTIDLKNAQNNLWVKSDQIKFNSAAESGKWLLYNLAALSNTGVVSQTLAIDSSKGFSAEGARTANEKIGSVRCFKYSLDNVELGNSLTGIGISSDSIQSISGTAWIGIKDKLLRRLDLKVTTSPSSPIIQINLSLSLSDYDSNNNFAAPSSTDIVDTTVPVAVAAAAPVAAPVVVAPTFPNDDTRKADLAAIKVALEAYKVKYKAYPIAKTAVKLNVAKNILITKLVPKYIAAIPKDPADATGSVYTYQSTAGKTFTLTAQLENTADPTGIQSGAKYLYILTN